MADDQKPQPVQDSPSASQTSTSTSDQPSPPSAEQATPEATLPPDTQRPISSELAAGDQTSFSPATDTSTPSLQDQTIQSPPPEQPTQLQTLSDQAPPSPDDQRPESFEMADKTISQPEETTLSVENHRPDSSVLAVDSPSPPIASESQQPQDTTSAEGISPTSPSATPYDQQSQDNSSSQSAQSQPIPPPPSPEVQRPDRMVDEPPITPVSNLSDLKDLGNLDDISISPTDQQTPQVQSGVPNDASGIDAARQEDSSASFKPESLDLPQEAPLADENTQNSSPKSFGDLLSKANPLPVPPIVAPPIPPIPSTPPISSSLPPVSSPAPSVSFGDLIKDIEITPPAIPEAERPVEQQPPTPPSQIPPQVSPISPQSTQSPLSPLPSNVSTKEEQSFSLPKSDQLDQSPQITSQPQASAPPEIPVVDKDEVERQIRERLKLEQIQRRQLAQQFKTQRIAKNLEKILELAKTKEYITNLDVRDLLHISQSTATNYFKELATRGSLKREGKSKYIRYSLP